MCSQIATRIHFLVTALGSYPNVLFFYSPLLAALTLIGVAIPFATGRFIDTLALHQPFHAAFALLSVLLVVKMLLSPLLERFICSLSRKVETDLQFRILDATMSLSPGQLIALPDGEIIAKMTRDSFVLGGFVRGLYPRLLQASVMMLATGLALYSRSKVLFFAFFAFIPLTIALFAPFARRFRENSHRLRKQGDASFNTLFDFFLSLPFLRTLDVERRFADVPHNALREFKCSNDASDTLSVWFGFILSTILIGGEIAVLGIAGSLAAEGRIPIGDVVLYQMLFITAIQAVQNVITLLPELSGLREAIDSLSETLLRNLPEHPRGRLPPLETLAFEHVTFAYPQAPDHPVVKDFSAVLRVGTVVGLSGSNGAGKSTLLKLAIGALDPQEGSITVNGLPFGKINQSLFRLRIGVVLQDNLLVTGTIRDNITLRDPNLTPADIDRALALSGFDIVVKRLTDGLDTRVGNLVRTLSGGERQRLAIARAIIRDPEILILDEASNHLDAEARKVLVDLLAKLRPGRLVLIAGHDQELDKLCDARISCQIIEHASYITM